MKTIYLLGAACLCLNSACVYASGDAKNGEALYASHCIACHSVEASLAGPAHRGVYGRKAGAVADFDYSSALKRSKVVWNEKTLDKWLADPEKFIPGQKMAYAVSNAADRADLISFLKQQAAR